MSSGSLPAGLTLAPSTGILSGKATVAGTYSFTVSLTDSSTVAASVTQAYTLNISPTISTTSLANGVAGTAYSQQLAYSGGTVAVFAVTSGSLPTGLVPSPSGAITGTPTNMTAGTTYQFSVVVTIGSASSAAASLTISIDALPVVTTSALPSGNIGVAYSQQLSYSGGSGGAASWAITAGSLPAASGLTLNASTGAISGTPTTAATYSFSVAVTIGTQTSVSQALTLSVYSLLITSSTTVNGEVGLPLSFRLTGAGGTAPYTWALGSNSNALPTGLTLNGATGLISGTPTTNAGSPFTGIVVVGTDHVGATASQSMTFTISAARSAANNAVLNGQYAFLLNGFDATGHPLAMAGELTADGSGHITAGVVDVNGTGLAAPILNSALSATTYSVGPDDRGELTLTYNGTTQTFVFALDGTGAGGCLTEFDASGQTLTGALAQQTASAFTTPAITGGYSFGLDGFAAGSAAGSLTRRAVIGETQFNGTNSAASAELLSTAIASATPSVPSATAVNINTNGRGLVTYTLPSGGSLSLVVYVVSSTKLFAISSASAADLLSGQYLQQTIVNGSSNLTSLSAISVVRSERLTLNAARVYVPDVQVGLFNFNGGGKLTLSSDEDNGGAVTSNVEAGGYTVATNGRVTYTAASGFSGCADCVSSQSYMYLVGANQGFLMDLAASPNFGYFEPQTATVIANPTLLGSYSSGTLAPLAQAGTYLSEALSATGTGSMSGTADTATAGTLSPDTPITASYSLAASGRGTIATTGSGQVLYVISPTRSLLLDLTSASPVVQEITKQ